MGNAVGNLMGKSCGEMLWKSCGIGWRGKSQFKKGSDWQTFSIWNRVMGANQSGSSVGNLAGNLAGNLVGKSCGKSCVKIFWENLAEILQENLS